MEGFWGVNWGANGREGAKKWGRGSTENTVAGKRKGRRGKDKKGSFENLGIILVGKNNKKWFKKT
jgi:hypothetical protein